MLVLASLAYTVHPWFHPTNDGAMYVVTARNLADGQGYSMLGEGFRIRPPGFAVMIAPLLAARGTDFFALNLFVGLWGALGVVLLYLFVRPRLGTPLALIVAIGVWANPAYQVLCNQPMSDVPGTTLLLGCLLLERWAARRPSLGRDALLGLAIGASAYVRTVNVLLAPAILTARLLARQTPAAEAPPLGRRVAGAALLVSFAVLAQVPWSVRNTRVATEPPAEQTLLYSYGSGMFHTDMGDPRSPRLTTGEILERFPVRSSQLAATLGVLFLGQPRGAWPWIVTAASLLATLWVFWKRRSSPEPFVLASLAIVSVYFGYAPRLMLPVWIFLFPNLVEAVRDLAALAGRRTALAVASAVALLLAWLPFEPRKDWDMLEAQHRALIDICTRFEARMHPDDVLATQRGWFYSVMLDRPVYSLEFAVQRAGDLRASEDVIERHGITAVLLSPARTKDVEILPYFEARYGPQPGPARVYRVR